jgi:hypothetical protein
MQLDPPAQDRPARHRLRAVLVWSGLTVLAALAIALALVIATLALELGHDPAPPPPTTPMPVSPPGGGGHPHGPVGRRTLARSPYDQPKTPTRSPTACTTNTPTSAKPWPTSTAPNSNSRPPPASGRSPPPASAAAAGRRAAGGSCSRADRHHEPADHSLSVRPSIKRRQPCPSQARPRPAGATRLRPAGSTAFGIGSPAPTFSPQVRLDLGRAARRVEGPRLHRKERRSRCTTSMAG